jgi:tetratricopeptide (TPR) repeat protein
VKAYCIISHGLPETDLLQVSAKLEPEGFQWNLKNAIGIAASFIGFFLIINFMFLRIGFADESEVPSIAIIPLDNKGAEADDFYAYGISSDLISDVTSAGLIRVASLNRIEDLGDISANEMADQLDVRYIAEGTLWKRDSIFQLSMELYDTKTEKVVWSERWQKNWNEFPSIRDVLAENILEKLKVDYNTASPKIALNPDAYEFYLKAIHNFRKRENKDDAKIAQGLADEAIELDDNLIRAKVFLANTYTEMGDNDKAIEVLGPALEQAQRLGDKQGEAAIFSTLGTTYMNKGNLDQMIGYHEKALEIYQETGNTEKLYHNLYTIGYAHKDKGDLDKGLDYLKRSLIIAENLDNKIAIKNTLYVIGTVYRNKGDIDTAQDFLKRGQALAVTGLTKEETGVFHLRDGIMCYEMCEYENAIEFFNNANKILEEVANIPKYLYSLYFTGITYNSIGSYDTALDYFERGLEQYEQLDDRLGIAMNLYGIGYQHHSMGDYDKAIEYLDKSCIILKEAGAGYQYLIQPTTALFLTCKNLGREFDKEEIHTIVNNSESFEFYINIRLYKLLDNRSYLETAYSQVQKIARYLEPDIAKKFLNYPIPKQIIQEWEGVS